MQKKDPKRSYFLVSALNYAPDQKVEFQMNVSMISQLEPVAEHLIIQQMFVGNDTITDRTGQLEIKVKKSTQVMNKIKARFIDEMEYWDTENPEEWLRRVSRSLRLKEKEEKVISDFREQTSTLSNAGCDEVTNPIIAFTFATKSILSFIRGQAFDDAMKQLEGNFDPQLLNSKKVIESLLQEANPEIYLFINLAFLLRLSRAVRIKTDAEAQMRRLRKKLVQRITERAKQEAIT